jgi:hypothetical protein
MNATSVLSSASAPAWSGDKAVAFLSEFGKALSIVHDFHALNDLDGAMSAAVGQDVQELLVLGAHANIGKGTRSSKQTLHFPFLICGQINSFASSRAIKS